jgi:hypothetical protein
LIDSNKVQTLCSKYNINCNIYSDTIYITTALNTWIAEDKDTHFMLKHKNKRAVKHTCHMHDKKFKDINSVIDYINKHDTKTIFDRRYTHERRLDRLINQISIHNKSNKNINKKSITI